MKQEKGLTRIPSCIFVSMVVLAFRPNLVDPQIAIYAYIFALGRDSNKHIQPSIFHSRAYGSSL
jgi:hypothetical protein